MISEQGERDLDREQVKNYQNYNNAWVQECTLRTGQEDKNEGAVGDRMLKRHMHS